jgi:hypothetical protein
MTGWKITIRTAPGAPIAAEYFCPLHGRFAVDVSRDENGDPPTAMACPERVGPVFATEEFGEIASSCGESAIHVISAPGTARVRRVEAHRGGYQRPEFETWTNTENLGEGQDLDDWKEDRAKVWQREREREAMELARDL